MQITFTLDLEDHRADPRDEPHHVRLTTRVLEFLGERGIRGTFFVVGDVVEQAPDLMRTIAAEGHELALHSFRHIPLPEVGAAQFTHEVRSSKDRLEDLTQQSVVGFRAPIFSLVPEAQWVVDELRTLGFEYSSSVMPIRHPLYGDPNYLAVPFRWSNGLVELPCPVLRVGRDGLPFLGAVWLRNFPVVATRLGLTMATKTPLLWTYAHPYDFDADEPFRVLPEAGQVGSRLLWRNRDRMFDRFDRLLRGRVASPLAERVAALPEQLDVVPVGSAG